MIEVLLILDVQAAHLMVFRLTPEGLYQQTLASVALRQNWLSKPLGA